MKSSILISTAALTVAVLLTSCGKKHTEKTALPETDEIPVKVASVSSLQTPDKIEATGLVTTENEGKYAFKIGGVVSKILVHEGQFFKKGQLLAALNTTEINSGLEQAKLNVEKANRDYTRAMNLYKDSVSTLEQVQNTKTALDVAKRAEDAVAFNNQYSAIYAASDGFVTEKIGNEGEVVAAGAPVLAISESKGNSDFELKVGVTDREWAAISIGQKASVTLDGYPGQAIPAYVFRKSQASDNAGGSFQVELKLQLGTLHPAAGMFGKADIFTGATSHNTVIPYDALIEADGNKAFIFEVDNNKVKRVPVVISGFDNKQVYIKSGLENVSNIVVSNSAFLNEQSTIKIIK
jgi:RND family efflux transporter MFP subunit